MALTPCHPCKVGESSDSCALFYAILVEQFAFSAAVVAISSQAISDWWLECTSFPPQTPASLHDFDSCYSDLKMSCCKNSFFKLVSWFFILLVAPSR